MDSQPHRDDRDVPLESIGTGSGRESPLLFAPQSESEELLQRWSSVQARELVLERLVEVEADMSVEEACEVLLSTKSSCLAIKRAEGQGDLNADLKDGPYLGLFDFSDVNAFLTLAATQHALHPDDLEADPRVARIVGAAKEGKVKVELVSNLSDKNPLHTVSEFATLVDLLRVFAGGMHRVVVSTQPPNTPHIFGLITDRSLLSYFFASSSTKLSASVPPSSPTSTRPTPTTNRGLPMLTRFLSNPLHSLSLPSINLRKEVVSCTPNDVVLDAMKMMSVEGVSSVAVVSGTGLGLSLGIGGDGGMGGGGIGQTGGLSGTSQGYLVSAVSVTDIGMQVVRSTSKQILSTPIHHFITQIKFPDGSTDGADRFPVYSVSAAHTLRYAVEKILATNAHRVFVTEDVSGILPPPSSQSQPSSSPSPSSTLLLRGLISIVDVLSLFAQLVLIDFDPDPTRMQRQRRMSSASTSSRSSWSEKRGREREGRAVV